MLNAISRLAYEFYAASGYAEGRDLENWLKAESFLKDVLDKLPAQSACSVTEKDDVPARKASTPAVAPPAPEGGPAKKPARRSVRKTAVHPSSMK